MSKTNQLTLQLWSNEDCWLDVATIEFLENSMVRLEYDIDYAVKYLACTGSRALSVFYPASLDLYRGPIPGFVLDLIPQGQPLRRLLARYQIESENNFEKILRNIPLASPGNIRVKEAWSETEYQKKSYHHPGFTLDDLIKHNTEFVSYMEQHGSPIGGTSGAGGGAPKFLLRQDDKLRFHADGLLDDAKTSRCFLVKFPFTDSHNSTQIAKTEKAYYDIARKLPIKTGPEIQIVQNILFIDRFDRKKIDSSKSILRSGLESFYSAHNINLHGATLAHEDNMNLILKHSTSPDEDVVEYFKRDLVNKLLANSDNHGRNTSFLKINNRIELSPIYDLTAMKFFAADFIVPLTRWSESNVDLASQIAWILANTPVTRASLMKSLRIFAVSVQNLNNLLVQHEVPKEFIEVSHQERNALLNELKNVTA